RHPPAARRLRHRTARQPARHFLEEPIPMRRTIVTLTLTVAALAGPAADDNWTQFRGPQAGVVADNPALPERWSPTENIVWSTEIPGTGWGSPIVWGDHVIVTSAVNTEDSGRPK